MKATVLFVTAIVWTGLATAPGRADSMEVASNLASVLASEEPCGLTYDQAAIEAFIADKVPADDMNFTGMLTLMQRGNAAQIREMSASARTAHCAQIKRVVKSYGFTK